MEDDAHDTFEPVGVVADRALQVIDAKRHWFNLGYEMRKKRRVFLPRGPGNTALDALVEETSAVEDELSRTSRSNLAFALGDERLRVQCGGDGTGEFEIAKTLPANRYRHFIAEREFSKIAVRFILPP
ncbi:MAG: hypothetical protein JSS66_19080 [Armatimonadetes bacterium]|nr:hypothetical protein [Armatimonadota bacterium]